MFMVVWLKMLRRGKHRGKRFEDVAAIDRGYCAWVLREKALPLHSFYRYLIKAHGGILNVGKQKGRYFDEVLEGAPEYCEWALNLKEPHETLHLFIDYLRVHAKKESAPCEPPQEPPEKKPKTDEKLCVVCFDRPIDTVFVPCGHLAACMPCGSKFDNRPCPLCKTLVAMVLKTYVA